MTVTIIVIGMFVLIVAWRRFCNASGGSHSSGDGGGDLSDGDSGGDGGGDGGGGD